MDSNRRPARGILIALSVCLVLGAGECRKKNSPAAEGGDPAGKDVVLRVENASYTVAAFEKYLKLNAGDDWKALDAQALSRMFDNYAQEKLLLAQARKHNIILTDDERRGYLAKLKSASTVMGSDAPAAVDDEETAERLLVEKYMTFLVSTLNVDDAEIARYYDAQKKDFLQPERLQVSQILVDSEGKATALLDKLKNATEEQFRAMAKTESKGVEAPKGGLLGEFSAGQLPGDLEKAIFPLKTGELSRVVESSYGYHIFRLDSRSETRLRTLTEAAPSIRAKLLEEKSGALISAHVEESKSSLVWSMAPEKLPFEYKRIES